MMGPVLLTGGMGFVGRQVLRSLLGQGEEVRLVVRMGNQEQLVPSQLVGSTVATPDMFAEDSEWWSDVCCGIDTVIHCAWHVEHGNYLHSPKNLDCLIGTLCLAKGAANAGVRRFIGVGTCEEYDQSGGLLSIDTPLRPQSVYGGSKAATFNILSHWFPARQVEFAWCRLFNLYGEGENSLRLASYVRAKLMAGDIAELTGGYQIRDYLDVAVAGDMISEVACGSVQGAVNICSGIPITVREFVERLADIYGGRELLKFGARPDNPFEAPIVYGLA